jgi:hypothetical protein
MPAWLIITRWRLGELEMLRQRAESADGGGVGAVDGNRRSGSDVCR